MTRFYRKYKDNKRLDLMKAKKVRAGINGTSLVFRAGGSLVERVSLFRRHAFERWLRQCGWNGYYFFFNRHNHRVLKWLRDSFVCFLGRIGGCNFITHCNYLFYSEPAPGACLRRVAILI
jgi:hypothetical protein